MLWFFESFFPVAWIAFLIYWRIKAAGEGQSSYWSCPTVTFRFAASLTRD